MKLIRQILISSVFVAVSLPLGCFAQAAATAQQVLAKMPAEHAAVFKQFCYDCHDAQSAEGGIDLESIPFDIGKDIPTAERWQKILNALNSKEMPPEGETQIPAKAKTAFLDSLSNQIVLARKILSDNGGVITMRRLNRREYQNTMEELLGIRPDVSSLPDDQASAKFDTLGASLFFSSDQLEQYLSTAKNTIELALATDHSTKSSVVRIEPESYVTDFFANKANDHRDILKRSTAFFAQSKKPATEFGFIDKYQAKKSSGNSKKWLPQMEEYLARPETKHGATMMLTIKGGMTRIKFNPVNSAGNYVMRVRAAAYPDTDNRLQYLEFTSRETAGAGFTRLGWRKISGTLDNPQLIEFPIEHPHGKKIQYLIHQRTHQGRGDKNLWAVHLDQNGMGTAPGTWIDWAELEGPLPAPGTVSDEPAAISADQAIARMAPGVTAVNSQKIKDAFFARPDGWSQKQYVKEVIRRFATRAFRSESPQQEFLDKLYAQFESNQAKGENQQTALTGPLSIILSSPSFLYMVETDEKESANNESGNLTDRELAVRLSYFLWSSPPDQELLSLATRGELADADVLKQQTSRLLADDRANRFVLGFVRQWLQMERLEMFEFKARLFPQFDNATRESARDEVYETFKTVMAERLPLATFLNADFVVINDVLADYYGLPGVAGHEFRKINLPSNSPRGGLLGSAAVLAMGSDGIRSSPVERGAWVLRHLLNDPPPPAPANVPQLARLEGQVLAARELQKVHMEEPQCAQCHRKIDPIGYGLEHFDAAGGWREKEAVEIGNRNDGRTKQFPINSEGSLPDGSKFNDFFELRAAVTQNDTAFARGFVEELIAYALGRPFGFTDEELADQITQHAKANGTSVDEFIHALVQSKTFRSK